MGHRMKIIFLITSVTAIWAQPLELVFTGIHDPEIQINVSIQCTSHHTKNGKLSLYNKTSRMRLPVEITDLKDGFYQALFDPQKLCNLYSPDYLPSSILVQIYEKTTPKNNLVIELEKETIQEPQKIIFQCTRLTRKDLGSADATKKCVVTAIITNHLTVQNTKL